jgi:hypothetical protein
MNSNVLPCIRRIIIICTILFMTIIVPINVRVSAADAGSELDAAISGSNELYPGDDTYIQISVQNNSTIDEIDPLVQQAGYPNITVLQSVCLWNWKREMLLFL